MNLKTPDSYDFLYHDSPIFDGSIYYTHVFFAMLKIIENPSVIPLMLPGKDSQPKEYDNHQYSIMISPYDDILFSSISSEYILASRISYTLWRGVIAMEAMTI